MSFRQIVPLLWLAAATLVVWCALTERWSIEAWQTPVQFSGDPVEIYTRVKAAQEDLTQPLRGFAQQPRLAAPFGANWSRYPISNRVTFTVLGLLARAIGVFAAVNVAMAFANVLNALSFYLCARFLRWRREWAMAAALLFAFCSYNFRWSITVSFSLSFFIPPLLLLCGWIARPAPAVAARGWTWLAVALGVWLGEGNPYLGFFAVQLAGGAVLLQFLRRREFARWRAGVTLICVAGVSFLLHNAAYFLAHADGGRRLTLVRNYAGSEIYALKPIDLLIPPIEHPLAAFRDLAQAYQAQSALRTEFFVNYLGIAGLAGLALILGIGLLAIVRRSRRRVPDAFLGVMWTLLFSAVGGVNSLLALGGFDLFRASNRNSIFILVWSLFFLGRTAQRRWRPTGLAWRWALPVLIAALGIYDSVPRIDAGRAIEFNAARLRDTRALLARLETRIGSNAMVFQIPSTVFPEAGTVVKMPDYAHLSAYILSHSLRFSYGALRGTAVSRCLRALGRLPPLMLKQELESTGFRAIWIDRRGLPEKGDELVQELQSLGIEEYAQTELPWIEIFLLHPSAHPRPLDLADTRLYEPWDIISALEKPQIVVYDGWYDLERDGDRSWRWAQDLGTAGIRMPHQATVDLTFDAYSLARGQLVVLCDGHEVYRQPISPTSRDARAIRLNLGQGRHFLEWRFTGRVSHPDSADGRLLGFAVENLHVAEINCDPPRL